LAKTVYSLVAGEAPRRFAQHAIRELPVAIATQYWSRPLLRVLEKATQTQPENRYQTVREFWDELAEATLPPTQPLTDIMARRKPSADLNVAPNEIPKAPPKPHFETVATVTDTIDDKVPSSDITDYSRKSPAYLPDYPPRTKSVEPEKRPKIVVRVEEAEKLQNAKPARPAAEGAVVRDIRRGRHPRAPVEPRRARPYIVAAVLIVAFVGMLLATHRYVTSQWNPFSGVTRVSDLFVVGREGVTTTDVRLRPDASTNNPPVGLAENGSRVKILATDDNWYEVQVLEHGRAKTDPFTSDRGWINKRFVRFD
jgi:hypothetical protein